ncbi:MAG TPA: nodulation protein NfeD [Dehalococcoidia bacterium]|nr:nodulation protein NfeD [Dehalococcoidia bacterium]
MSRFVRILLMVAGLLLLSTVAGAQTGGSRIDVLTIKGTINPVLVDYLSRGIEQAEETGAQAIIIQMDTPGGLDTAMRDIIQDIVNARIPVIVYVSPAGARAASAGAYITLAAHIAVMAPNTAIGAATPIAMGGDGEAAMSDELKAKILNDAIAYIRDIAESHGRNADWAEKAVREGVSATSQEALELNVIDMIAPDLDTLITQLDGWEVTMLGGNVVTLNTQDVTINYVGMKPIEKFLYAIADPNIAFLLLSIATLGIMIEIFNPGLIFPGVVGAISGILAFYALGQLPVNIAGILLIVLAFGLFVGEALTTTFGLFTMGGVTSLVIGALILFQGAAPVFKIDPRLIGIVTVIIAGLFAFVVNRAVRAHRRQAATGREELVGKKAVVKVALDPEGTVFYKGERWSAISDQGRVEPGEEVIITSVDGLTLHVVKKEPGSK